MEKSGRSEASVTIRMMLPEDAPEVVELFRSIYGDEYPIKSAYDAECIIEQQNSGKMIRIVAVADDGRVVGHLAARSCLGNSVLFEETQGLVLTEYRNQGIMDRCMKYGHKEVYPQKMEQLWGEAVCHHIYTQKVILGPLGCYETGVELDLMPAATYQKELSSDGRVSSLIIADTYKALAQTIYLPKIYENSLRYIYSVCDFGHRFLKAGEPLPASPTTGQTEIYGGAGVARFWITNLGSDFEAYLLQQEKEALSQNACVLQLYLNLASPCTGEAIETLLKHKFFLGGVLPRWFDSDGLLMQKILHEPNYAGIHLYTDRAREILAIIQDDRNAVMA